MMPILAFAEDYIRTWEDGGSSDPARTLSLDPDDPGNWTSGVCGKGTLCGSQHGVTAQALAKFSGSSADAITEDVMRALPIEQAAQIALRQYYAAPGLDKLPWDEVVASVMDFGWGAGPRQAVLLLQRAIAVADDGEIGPYTVRAYQQWIKSHGLEGAASMWGDIRNDFYRLIVAKRPVNQKYLHGWMRRTAYFLPGTPWWARFRNAS